MMELTKTIGPHDVEESQDVNNVRTTIIALSGPLVKIRQSIRSTVVEMKKTENGRIQKKITKDQSEKEFEENRLDDEVDIELKGIKVANCKVLCP